jgi:hypothetical protein
LAAQNNQHLYKVEEDIYEALGALFLEQGLAAPSGSQPFSGDELLESLHQIEKHKLSRAGKRTYEYIVGRLNPRTWYDEIDGFGANASLEMNLETYLHSNPVKK